MKKFKKSIALVLTVLMLSLSLAACGSSTPDAFKGKLLEPFVECIQTNQYTYEAKSVDGSGSPLTYAKYGNDKIMVTTTVNDASVTMMLKDGGYYIVSAEQKAYTDATGDSKTTVENLINQFTLDNFVTATFVESGSCKIGDTEYQYEDYYTAVSQTKNRFFFDSDDNLVMMGNVQEDGSIKSYTYISIYNTNASTFDVLSSYQYVAPDGSASSTAAKADSTTKASK